MNDKPPRPRSRSLKEFVVQEIIHDTRYKGKNEKLTKKLKDVTNLFRQFLCEICFSKQIYNCRVSSYDLIYVNWREMERKYCFSCMDLCKKCQMNNKCDCSDNLYTFT